jgi:hypothetical protein
VTAGGPQPSPGGYGREKMGGKCCDDSPGAVSN